MGNIFDIFRKLDAEREADARAPISYLVVGLGNPGDEYRVTRHNTGFLAVDKVAASVGATITRARFKSLVGEANIGGARVLLMKPQTYMNASGEAVREAAAFYKIDPSHVLVICDDVNFDVGKMRIRRSGSDGGQRGVRSIIQCLGSDAFPRIRVGIGHKPSPDYDLADFVLSKFGKAELDTLDALFADVCAAVGDIVRGDIDGAMCRYSK